MLTVLNDKDSAKRWQKLATGAFAHDDFGRALEYCDNAARFYRETPEGGGYGVETGRFFVENLAIQCLEQLLTDRDESFARFPQYCDRTKSFLDDWPLDTIRSAVLPPRVREAILERTSRETTFKVKNAFYQSKVATAQGDFDEAHQILENLVEWIKGTGDSEADGIYAVARSKVEMLRVKRELKKRPQDRETRVLVLGYLRAAWVSRLPARSPSMQGELLAVHRANFWSVALKFRAFDVLRQSGSPERLLGKAQQYFAKAVEYAGRAKSLGDSHVAYLGYWHQIVSERAHLIAFMSNGDPADYKRAVDAWENAVISMNELCSHTDESEFFPNRFLSRADLELDHKYLAAAKAFRDERWADCVLLLEEWRKKLPIEFYWSWRDANVHARLLGAKVVDAAVCGDHDKWVESSRALTELSNFEPVGEAARNFATEAKSLRAKMSTPSALQANLDWLKKNFPLDSWQESTPEFDTRERFTSLPSRVHDGLSIGTLAGEAELGTAKRRVLGAVEALLGYACDYYWQQHKRDSSVPACDVDALIEECLKLPLRGGKGNQFLGAVASLKVDLDSVLSASGVVEFGTAFDSVLRNLHKLVQCVPVIVELRSTAMRTSLPYTLEAFPDWAVDRDGREKLYVSVDDTKCVSLSPGHYYIKPGMRKANRLFYPVSDERPILPVRYTPRWDYWAFSAHQAELIEKCKADPMRKMPVLKKVLEKYVPDNGIDKPLRGMRVLITGLHFFQNFLGFIAAMQGKGLDPELTTVFHKDPSDDAYGYPAFDQVAYLLKEQKYELQPIDQIQSDENARKWCERLGTEVPRPLLIVEDGGFLTPAILENPDLISRVVGTVEQTTKGVRNIKKADEKHPVPFPIVCLPPSDFKKHFEGPHIGDATVHALKTMLPHISLRNKHIAVIGCGVIGESIIAALSPASVSYWDESKFKMIKQQNKGGGKPASSAIDAVKDADIVLGAVGDLSIFDKVIDNVKSGVYLASASSGFAEIDVSYLKRTALESKKIMLGALGERTDINPKVGDAYHLPDGRIINVLKNGAPINFGEFGQMSDQEADPIMTLIFLAATELAAGKYKGQTRLLPDDTIDKLSKEHGVDVAYYDEWVVD